MPGLWPLTLDPPASVVLSRPAGSMTGKVGMQPFGSHDVMTLYSHNGAGGGRRASGHLEVMRRKDIFYSGSLLNIPQYK